MKNNKNLTRFTYETTAFQGWRLNIVRSGTKFIKYFSDKKHGGERKSLEAAENAKIDLLNILDSAKKVNGKLSQTTINKATKFLKNA